MCVCVLVFFPVKCPCFIFPLFNDRTDLVSSGSHKKKKVAIWRGHLLGFGHFQVTSGWVKMLDNIRTISQAHVHPMARKK